MRSILTLEASPSSTPLHLLPPDQPSRRTRHVTALPPKGPVLARGSDVSVLSATAPATPLFLPGPAPLASRAVNGP